MEMVTMTMAHLAVELSDTWDLSAKTTCPFGLLLGARHHCLCIRIAKGSFSVSDLVADFQMDSDGFVDLLCQQLLFWEYCAIRV